MSIVAAVVGGALTLGFVLQFPRLHWVTRQGEARDQPIPFSHVHHVAGMGVDCRYCHTSAKFAAKAGIPPTRTCMNCHSQIWSDSPTLEPVRASFRDDVSIVWTKVHDLPDFVYFEHSAHVNKGVGCTTCHGPVDKMWMRSPISKLCNDLIQPSPCVLDKLSDTSLSMYGMASSTSLPCSIFTMAKCAVAV